MTRSASIALFSFLCLTAGLAGSARADDACAADRDRLCAAAKGRAKMACMKEHEAELSDACKAQRASMKQVGEEVHADCKADADKLCTGIKPGHGRIMACLKSHTADVSDACKQALSTAKEMNEQIHPGCKPDVDKFCQGIQPGGGRIMGCLQSHQAELSPVCANKLQHRAMRQGGAPDSPPAK